MSLIEEALRRLQDPALPSVQTAPEKKPRPVKKDGGAVHPWETTHPADPAAPAAPPQTTMTVAVALAMLILTAALITGGVIWLGRVLGERPLSAKAPQPQQVPIAQAPQDGEKAAVPAVSNAVSPIHPAVVSAASANRPGAQNRFVLSGIVGGQGRPYAVINGSIVTVGEHVGGATLLSIGEDSARLRLADGKEVDLRIPR